MEDFSACVMYHDFGRAWHIWPAADFMCTEVRCLTEAESGIAQKEAQQMGRISFAMTNDASVPAGQFGGGLDRLRWQ